MNFQPLREKLAQLRRFHRRFTWGGGWAAVLSAEKRRNLTLFFYDGVFSAGSDKIILTYLSIYILALGATPQQIGLLSSLSNFTAALLLMPAALLVERSGKRKQITLTSRMGNRIAVLLMAVVPFFLWGSSALIWIILSLALLREAFINLGYPGWVAFIGDIVPLEGRGRYFGTRNFVMGIIGIFAALFVGEAITRIGEPLGYQLALILSVTFGLISILFFTRLTDPQGVEDSVSQSDSSVRAILKSLKGQKQFIFFCLFTAVWNFSLNIAGPFFNVFMVDTLSFTAAMIGIITVANTLAHLIVQRRVGVLTETWGNRKTSLVFMFLIPLITLSWGLWARQYWHVILIETIGGLIWGAYDLVSFNNLLLQTPEKQRARFSAIYQIVVTLSMAGGAALGAFLIPSIEFKGIAILSAGGRWLAAILFMILITEPGSHHQAKIQT